ncbi:MAG: helix-turn-helix transcriptional regulator [Pseudomonadota bacterium]
MTPNIPLTTPDMSSASRPSETRAPHPIDLLVAQRIKSLREEKGLSQQALAVKCGISFQQFQKYERGKNRISTARLFSISQAMGVSVTSFLGGLDTSPPDEARQSLIGRLGTAGHRLDDVSLGHLVALAEQLSQ